MQVFSVSPTYVPTSSYIIQSFLGGDVAMAKRTAAEALAS